MEQQPSLGGLGEQIQMRSDLSDFFRGKHVLVTGHTGFKGAWLAKTLIDWGASVTGVSLQPYTQPNLFTVLKLEKSLHNYFTDIRDYNELQKIFTKEQPEIVFHLAAQAIVKVSYDDPLTTYSTNVLGTANVLECIRRTSSVKSAVIITSDKAYDNVEWVYPYRETDKLGGQDPYSASKGAADIIAQSFIKSFLSMENSPLVAITRAGNVIGGGDWAPNRIVPDIARYVFEKKTAVPIRSPHSIRPWQFVLEPLGGYLLLAQKLYSGDRSLVTAWNFGPSDENFVPVVEIVSRGLKIFGEGSYEIQTSGNFHEAKLLKLDISKAKSLLSWHPRLNFAETIEYTFGWYRNYYLQKSSIIKFTEDQITEYFAKKI